jgi:hypothetical protein
MRRKFGNRGPSTDTVAERASRVRTSLVSRGTLNLWEVRAILSEPRDEMLQVLRWMASRNEISYRIKDDEWCVTLVD